jgi:hypothetical protein
MAERGDGRPTNNLPEIFDLLSRELAAYERQLMDVWTTDLARANAELARLDLPPVDPQCTRVEGCAAKP